MHSHILINLSLIRGETSALCFVVFPFKAMSKSKSREYEQKFCLMRQHFLTLPQMKMKELHTQGLVISSRLETCYLSAPHHYLPSLSHPPHTRCCSNSSSGSRYLVINGVNFAPDKKKRGAHFTVHYFKASVETKAQCLLH